MTSVAMKKAYSEVDSFLNILTDEERNKVPEDIKEYIKSNKDPNYTKDINANEPISSQNLMKETLGLIAVLNLEYWCNDETEKQRLLSIYKENDKKNLNNIIEFPQVNENVETKEEPIIEETKEISNNNIATNNTSNTISSTSNNYDINRARGIAQIERRIIVVKKENIFTKIYNFLSGFFKKK